MTLKLTTTYQIEGEYYVAYCVELGVTSQGKTFEDAEKNLQEAVELYCS
ncbi:MAG: type II toxin-antitoxin system HicB family antitoxin [Patescibacteria group bacterium]